MNSLKEMKDFASSYNKFMIRMEEYKGRLLTNEQMSSFNLISARISLILFLLSTAEDDDFSREVLEKIEIFGEKYDKFFKTLYDSEDRKIVN